MDPEATVRTRRMVGEEGMARLEQAHVAVFGLGGVGSYLAEALARAGVGALTLVDKDRVDVSNLNRQLYALTDTVGEPKTAVAADRIRRINPDCRVTALSMCFLPDTASAIDFSVFDYVADAIDNVTAKIELAKRADAAGTPIISVMGTGNKWDPTKLTVTDIHKTSGCPLARIVRRLCRENGIRRLKVVYSPEEPSGDGNRPPASLPFVPPVAGMIAAGEIIRDLIQP